MKNIYNIRVSVWRSKYPPKNISEKRKESSTLSLLLYSTSSSASRNFYNFSFIIWSINIEFVITWFYFLSGNTLSLCSSRTIKSTCSTSNWWTSKEWILSPSCALSLMLTPRWLSRKGSRKEKSSSSTKRTIIYHLILLLWNSFSYIIFLFFISKPSKWVNFISCTSCIITWLSSHTLSIKSISSLSFIPIVLLEQSNYFI